MIHSHICSFIGILDSSANVPPSASTLDLEPGDSKPQMFKAVQEQIYYFTMRKSTPCALPSMSASTFPLIMNHVYDSLNCFTLILCGESYFNRTLAKPVNEALRQRVVIHYDF